MMAENYVDDDRRRMVGAGVRHGRDAEIQNMQAITEVWLPIFKSTMLATRGTSLALRCVTALGQDQGPNEFLMDVFSVLEFDADERQSASDNRLTAVVQAYNEAVNAALGKIVADTADSLAKNLESH